MIRIGLSPHAPYSVDPRLYRRIVEHVSAHGLPVCTHLAETQEEVRFLADGRGPFRDMLERWNLWDGSFELPHCSPVEYAARTGLLKCSPVLVHVNYASDADLDLLGRHACHVVYCPRSHRFFGHEPHPYRRMLGRGINVCLGTDSLASNESLSVLDEMRFLARLDSDLSVERILAMGTIAGARALGIDDALGTIETGKRAELFAVPLCSAGTRNPVGDCLHGQALPSGICAGGMAGRSLSLRL